MPSKNGKIYKNYGLLNIFHNDLSSIPLSLYNPTNYLRRREMGFNSISKIQPRIYMIDFFFKLYNN